jgi:hypothetical protein
VKSAKIADRIKITLFATLSIQTIQRGIEQIDYNRDACVDVGEVEIQTITAEFIHNIIKL